MDVTFRCRCGEVLYVERPEDKAIAVKCKCGVVYRVTAPPGGNLVMFDPQLPA